MGRLMMLTADQRTDLALELDELRRQLHALVEVAEVRLNRVAAVLEGAGT